MAKEKKRARRARTERRFEPRSPVSPSIIAGLGAVGSAALGAGVYGQFVRAASDVGAPLPYASWVLAGGAVVLGAAIWLGTSGEPPLRVGDGGLGVEKGGGVRRVPWHGIDSIRWESAKQALVVAGRDETGLALTVIIPRSAQPQAAAWLLKEATARIPGALNIDGETGLPAALEDAGEPLALEPVQVVGKRCVASGSVIAYEPDARVCPRCERAYHRDHVPDECACGGSLASVKAKKVPSPEATTAAEPT